MTNPEHDNNTTEPSQSSTEQGGETNSEFVNPTDIVVAAFKSPWTYVTMGLMIAPLLGASVLVSEEPAHAVLAMYVAAGACFSLAQQTGENIPYTK